MEGESRGREGEMHAKARRVRERLGRGKKDKTMSFWGARAKGSFNIKSHELVTYFLLSTML